MDEALHLTIEGLVQGVGFRHALKAQASMLGLTGWVSNLPDGRVEARAEGPRETLETLLAWCHKGPALSKVAKVDSIWGDAKLDGIPDHDTLVEMSMEGTAGQHPSILSLQPMKTAEGEFPSLGEGGDDWKFLRLALPIKVGDESGSIAVQLVYEGAGDL